MRTRTPALDDFFAGRPASPIGYRRNGCPIWSIAGGSEGGTEDPAAEEAAAKEAADATAKEAADAATAAEKEKAAAEKVEDLPEWAQKALKSARKEAGDARTNAKKAAAEEAQTDVLRKVLEGLGIKGTKEPTLEEVQAELEKTKGGNTETQQQLKTSRVELAVYRMASKNGGDPDALLDSRGFLAKTKDLDPDADDFNTKLATAIKDAVKDNDKLKASRAGASSTDHGGSGGSGEPREVKPLDQAVSGHYHQQ